MITLYANLRRLLLGYTSSSNKHYQLLFVQTCGHYILCVMVSLYIITSYALRINTTAAVLRDLCTDNCVIAKRAKPL